MFTWIYISLNSTLTKKEKKIATNVLIWEQFSNQRKSICDWTFVEILLIVLLRILVVSRYLFIGILLGLSKRYLWASYWSSPSVKWCLA